MESTAHKAASRKGFLYFTEFICGVSIMAVELGASRLLSPYFSSSQIVWTIIIGTIMIAMALGNIYGGRSADKDPSPDKLYRRILIAGIWIALIPVLGKYVILAVSALVILSVNSAYLIWAALASCLVVFVFPLFLLGTTTPSLVKYSTMSLEENGRTVGNLEAFNTIGSIIGTFLPTFVTIPSVGTSITFLIFAALLISTAAYYFLSRKTDTKKTITAIIILLFSCIFGHSDSFAFWNKNLTYEGESIYNYLQVSEDDKAYYLSTNVLFGVQSMARKDGQLTGMYYDYAMAAPFMADINNKDNLDLLILGNGSGTYASMCEQYLDNVHTDGVEIDKDITELAAQYFGMPEDVNVSTYDGRAYLQAVDDTYDVIMVDAYQDISVPFQMSSVEFFTQVKDHLNPDGVMVINMNMRGEGEGNINEYLSDTIASIFPYVYTVDVTDGTNRELFASFSPDILSTMQYSIPLIKDEQLQNMMNTVSASLVPYAGGSHILTDDKAPVEVLSMRALDGIIHQELDYYKTMIKGKSIRELISLLTG